VVQVVDTNKGMLNQLKAQHAEQERDVERVRQREELLTQVSCCLLDFFFGFFLGLG